MHENPRKNKKTKPWTGTAYSLRPVNEQDAEYVVSLRAGNESRTQFLNPISSDIDAQRSFIRQEVESLESHYFVIVNRLTNNPEGLIGIYNVDGTRAEWGRWILEPNSIAATESVYLILSYAFNYLNLKEVFCLTRASNVKVLKFHDSIGASRTSQGPSQIDMDEDLGGMVRHAVLNEVFQLKISPQLLSTSIRVGFRNLSKVLGELKLHHIGIATESILQEAGVFGLLGYSFEGSIFEDENQGIRGLFLSSPNQTRIELLENLEGHNTLDHWLKSRTKIYHFGYLVPDLELATAMFLQLGSKVLRNARDSVYFGAPIVFLLMPNSIVLELIQEK